MPGGRAWLTKAATLLALACAGGVGAVSTVPVIPSWSADPDEQFLLDVNIRQLRLGEGVRAYQAPEGTCVVFGDFLAALDVPMRIDLAARKASGWAFREENQISIDFAGLVAKYGGRSEEIAAGTIRETPEGWCIQTEALSRWFGIGVKPLTAGSALMLESEARLPVELAIERQRRAARFKPASFDIASLPQVKLPYRMWRAPALDFVVSAGVTYRAKDGTRVDRRTSVHAAGEIARLSYDAQISTNEKGVPNAARVRAYRSDPDGRLLGPLSATHMAVGDVLGLDSRLAGATASGRGAVVTNRPLFNPAAFDRTRFEGDLPAGWDAEIYRNGELLAFAQPTGDQRYVFEDVQLLYGENRISIILYGPHGQVRTRDETITIGQENVPAGTTWYWAGVNQPGRDIVAIDRSPAMAAQPDLQAAVSIEHGLDSRTSISALARMMLEDDEKLTFVEGSVRRSIGSAVAEVAVARASDGGTAARAHLLAKFGSVNVNAEALIANDFQVRGRREESIREYKLGVNSPFRIGRAVIPAQADIGFAERADGSRQLEGAARLATTVDRFNLASHLRYRRHYMRSGPSPPGELDLELIGNGRFGDVRLRGSTSLAIAPETRLRSTEISAYWSASDRADWEGALAFEPESKRGRARASHIRRFDSLAVAITGEAATDGSMALGVNINFSLDPGRGFRLSRQPLAGAGVVHAKVYRDLNDNGIRDADEPLEKGALITAGTRNAERPTNAKGTVLVGGLAAFTPVVVGIDSGSLSDPMLVPRKAMQVVVPRPGVPAEVEIGLVGAGDIEGTLVKSGGLGFEGLDLELVDAAGQLIARARSDYDGFFLFERVPYGEYRLRVSGDAARAANVVQDLRLAVKVAADQSVIRLGTIAVDPLPRLASSE
ncbi:MAG TPA: carboxypeptidase-like regulatory domain-containing protein [Sphingomicrobium sp.]|nr:carboxypeptidase-like regulatory domain-containing protein [Sphingomicrobium sp.]